MMFRGTLAGLATLVLSAVSLRAATSEVADAVMRGQKAQVESLLGKKADVNAAQSDGTTALDWAVRSDNIEMVEALLKAGADVKASSRSGVTALYLACENGSDVM